VVAEDKPQGVILWVNEKARQAGVLPGLRYAAGASLTMNLRAGVVPPSEIEEAVEALTERLIRLTPEVEPSGEEPGVFWLNAAGLDLLYPSLEEWARSVSEELDRAGFSATVVVGFTRFGSYALARAGRGTVVFRNPATERAAAREVLLDRLDLDPALRDTLEKLGVRTVGAFLSLPPGGLRERFGPEAYRLYRMAAGDLPAPLQPELAQEPIRQALALDDPEGDIPRLLFLAKRLLHPMLAALVARDEALAELTLRLLLEGRGWREEGIRPAAPTLDAVQLLDLVRLRLETLALPSGVVEVDLVAQGAPAAREQLRVFAEQPRRDLPAGNRALARLRAEFGDQAVVRARLTDGHLSEESFTWEPLEQLTLPRPREVAVRTLVRRILTKPVLREPQVASRLHGPYVVSGGWWAHEAHRDYYFAETLRGDLLWVYSDHHRQAWFLHGHVE
jgi:protein ImuB